MQDSVTQTSTAACERAVSLSPLYTPFILPLSPFLPFLPFPSPSPYSLPSSPSLSFSFPSLSSSIHSLFLPFVHPLAPSPPRSSSQGAHTLPDEATFTYK